MFLLALGLRITGNILAVLFVMAIILGLSVLFWAWVLMIVLGSLHDHNVITQNWGFLTCLPYGIPLALILG